MVLVTGFSVYLLVATLSCSHIRKYRAIIIAALQENRADNLELTHVNSLRTVAKYNAIHN